MKKKLEDCTVKELFNICEGFGKYCSSKCQFDDISLLPTEGGCPIDKLMKYKDKEIEVK